jgi:hypothetical protein
VPSVCASGWTPRRKCAATSRQLAISGRSPSGDISAIARLTGSGAGSATAGPVRNSTSLAAPRLARSRFQRLLYLQKAIEAITGEKLHTLVERLVVEPLAMTRSNFIWDQRFEPNRACPHDAFGRPALGGKPGQANAASSFQTTAADFARFLLGVLDGSRLGPETAQLWLRPHIEVRHARAQNLEPSASDVATGVAWGLGCRLTSRPCNLISALTVSCGAG